MKASRAWAEMEKRIGPMIKPWDITKIRDQKEEIEKAKVTEERQVVSQTDILKAKWKKSFQAEEIINYVNQNLRTVTVYFF